MADRIGKPISQRQLRVGGMIKQSLSMIFIRNEAKVPNLETNTITVTEVRIVRDGAIIYTGKVGTLFREKNQVKEVGTGLECGLSIKDFIDFKEKEVIESYLAEEIQRSI